MGHRSTVDAPVGQQVDRAPVREHPDREVGHLLQRPVQVERRVEQVGGAPEEGDAPLDGASPAHCLLLRRQRSVAIPLGPPPVRDVHDDTDDLDRGAVRGEVHVGLGLQPPDLAVRPQYPVLGSEGGLPGGDRLVQSAAEVRLVIGVHLLEVLLETRPGRAVLDAQRLSMEESRSISPVTRSQCHVPTRPVRRANASRADAASEVPSVRSAGVIAKGLSSRVPPTVEGWGRGEAGNDSTACGVVRGPRGGARAADGP